MEGKSDTLHAILNNPFRLQHSQYSVPSRAYDLDDAYFHGVLWRKSLNGADDVPLMSVPTLATMRNFTGTVVLTAFRPGDMGPGEGAHFYGNVLAFQRYRDLEIDYGGRVPAGHDVGSAAHTVVLDARGSGVGVIETEVVVHVWR